MAINNDMTESPAGSSYQLILDHIFTYPGSYEMPLRTMYTINCASRPQTLRVLSPNSSTDSSPINQQFAFEDANQTFADNLMAQMAQMSTQPSSLPPAFITAFLRKCFPSELVYVDFPQALTGLDYLKDLEARRRREVNAAFSRLNIDKSVLENDKELSDRFPGVKQWVHTIVEKENKVEALYSQLYVALRRWIIINELSLLPFNKHNCHAMLNTLYPPVITNPPTARLNQDILKKQRQGFFKYIQSVERQGICVLSNLMQQGKAESDDNGWPAVTRTLNLYLHLANSMLNDCASITDPEEASPIKRGHRSKVDSGVSLPTSEKRPSTASSAGSDLAQSVESLPSEIVRPKTPSSRGGSALEKLARGLKSMGMSRVDVTEMVQDDTPIAVKSSPTKSKSLRKMRSMGNIGERRHSPNSSSSALDKAQPTFDVDEMRRQRMKFDAGTAHQQKTGNTVSHEI